MNGRQPGRIKSSELVKLSSINDHVALWLLAQDLAEKQLKFTELSSFNEVYNIAIYYRQSPHANKLVNFSSFF